jgi:hypothetical protein
MVRKSGHRFSEKIMLKQKDRAGWRFKEKPSGLYGAFFVKVASRHFGRPLHSILLFDPRREHSSVPTAYFHRRRAQRRSRTALLQRRRRLVLDGREHGGRLPAIGWLAAP